MESRSFNALLLEISEQLSQDQLEKLVYLCRDLIGKRVAETIDSGIKLFTILNERGKLGEDNTDFLSKMLLEIQRDDLLEKLKAFVGCSPRLTDDTENAKLEIAMEVISENLGRYWRRFGRKLLLKEVKLESIAKRHPTDVEETAMELLKEWRKQQGSGARVKDLIEALRACDLNLTADKLERRISCEEN